MADTSSTPADTSQAAAQPPPVMDLDAILARANLPTARRRICLNSGLYQQWQDAVAAAEAGSDRLSGSGAAKAAAEELRAQVEAESVEFEFRALPFTAYNRLVISYPPRKGNTEDEVWGFNTLEFFPALIRACLVSPPFSDSQFNTLLNSMNDIAHDVLANAAVGLNRREAGIVPFSSTASGQTPG
jgi:hypothetical protein